MIKQVSWLAISGILFFIGSCGETPAHKTASSENQTESSAYREQHRPQYHFSPKANWMNDPNGMVFYEGEYHLFYQYYPDSTVWGPMHWGHAVSTDMIHWEHLPVALYPDSLGYIFSGSAVVDWNNTSGFGQNGKPPLIAMFTYHDPAGDKAGRTDYQYQAIAYSTDKGRTWTKYDENPVIPNSQKLRDFRDPKVFWHEASQQWVMALAVFDHIKFWGSKNLKKWNHLSDFGKSLGAYTGVWECPDLFPLTVESSGETKWVLLVSINPGGPNGGSATQYFVGNFDGKNFTVDPQFAPLVTAGKAVWLDQGRDNYAGVTWSDIPKDDGRRLFLGWMSNWEYAQVVPTETWRSAMTIPRQLILKNTDAGYRVCSQPVRELEALRSGSHSLKAAEISGTYDLDLPNSFSPAQLELILDIEVPSGSKAYFGIELSNGKGETYRLGYEAATQQFISDRSKAGKSGFSEKFAGKISAPPHPAPGKTMQLHIFLDAASIELFADNGTTTLTEIFFPSEDYSQVKLFSETGSVRLVRGEVYSLKRIWAN